MTREHAQALLPIITAYAEGNKIQIADKKAENWQDCDDPSFDSAPYMRYRIKPEPDPYAELKEAHAAGRGIEGLIGGVWIPTKTPTWTYPVETYRIKPEPDPYAELKTAKANGAVIQIWNGPTGVWEDSNTELTWGLPVKQYRIKPEPDPYAELKAAHEAGKVIQLMLPRGWRDCLPDWSSSVDAYRIKPTPKLVPLTSDELPPVVWVKDKEGVMEMVTCVRECGSLETQSWLFKTLNDTYEGYTWSPDRKTWHSFMKEVEG